MPYSKYGSNRVWYVTHCSLRWLALVSVIVKYTLNGFPRPFDVLISGFNGDSNNCINISEIFSIPKDFFSSLQFYSFLPQTIHFILILVQLKYLFHLLTINFYFFTILHHDQVFFYLSTKARVWNQIQPARPVCLHSNSPRRCCHPLRVNVSSWRKGLFAIKTWV